jgi:hypothetical protein
MRLELDYPLVGTSPGGNQDWFVADPMMKLGGCGAVCACDSCLFFARAFGLPQAYPFGAAPFTKADYLEFSKIMKPYLRPRWGGIDRAETYMEGFSRYLADRGVSSVAMTALPGGADVSAAQAAIEKQLQKGLPVPCLILNHQNKAFEDYEWHWFMLAGLDDGGEDCLVETVTYSEKRWISLRGLWNTGLERRGGLVLYEIAQSEARS